MSQGIVEIINKTIFRTYNDGLDFWPDNMIEAIVNCLRSNNLIYIIEEIIPEEDEVTV